MKLYDLFEMPVTGYHTIGDFNKNSSFKKASDRRLVTNPAMVERTKKKLAGVPYDLNLIFINHPKVNKWEFIETGEVDDEWLGTHLPEKLYNEIVSKLSNDDAINIIYTNNNAAQHIPLTPWMIAHRMTHSFARRMNITGMGTVGYIIADIQRHFIRILSNILEEYNVVVGANSMSQVRFYDDHSNEKLKSFAYEIGTMRSAKQRKLRNFPEFFDECFAQYMLTGRIKFNPLPKQIKLKTPQAVRFQYRTFKNEAEYENCARELEQLAEYLEQSFHDMLGAAVNRVFIM